MFGVLFGMCGMVVHGDKCGCMLGFFIVNFVFDPRLVVFDYGIYVCCVGTFDFFVTGLLLVLLGRVMCVQWFLMVLLKIYEVCVWFGWIFMIGDFEGELVRGCDLVELLVLLIGRLMQCLFVYLVIKIGGKCVYVLVWVGEVVEIFECEVEVYRFDRIVEDCFLIECLVGIYVRLLIVDFGDVYCFELWCTWIGGFDVVVVFEEWVVVFDDVFLFFFVVELVGDVVCCVLYGVVVEGAIVGIVRLRDEVGLIVLVELCEGGLMKFVVGFCG